MKCRCARRAVIDNKKNSWPSTHLLQERILFTLLLKSRLPTAAAKMVFSRMDLDHNERVSVAEFTRFVEIGDANQIYLRTKWEYGSWSTFFSDNDRLLA